jgi:hypothetical protein
MPQKGTFTAPAAAHDNENIAAVDLKGKIPLDHKAAESHGEVFYSDVGFIFGHRLRHKHYFFYVQLPKIKND